MFFISLNNVILIFYVYFTTFCMWSAPVGTKKMRKLTEAADTARRRLTALDFGGEKIDVYACNIACGNFVPNSFCKYINLKKNGHVCTFNVDYKFDVKVCRIFQIQKYFHHHHQDSLGFLCKVLDVTEMEPHAEHNYYKSYCPELVCLQTWSAIF